MNRADHQGYAVPAQLITELPIGHVNHLGASRSQELDIQVVPLLAPSGSPTLEVPIADGRVDQRWVGRRGGQFGWHYCQDFPPIELALFPSFGGRQQQNYSRDLVGASTLTPRSNQP
jgi:hypothetical protein